jgi:hypothetical protein
MSFYPPWIGDCSSRLVAACDATVDWYVADFSLQLTLDLFSRLFRVRSADISSICTLTTVKACGVNVTSRRVPLFRVAVSDDPNRGPMHRCITSGKSPIMIPPREGVTSPIWLLTAVELFAGVTSTARSQPGSVRQS